MPDTYKWREKDAGIVLRYQDTSKRVNSPAWRAALFTIILDIPKNLIPTIDKQNKCNLLKDEWVRGRDQGIKQVNYAAPDPKKRRDPKRPLIFNKEAGAYFDDVLRQSITCSQADSNSGEECEGTSVHAEGSGKFTFYHKTFDQFDPEVYRELKEQWREDQHDVKDAPTGSVTLRSIEFAHFADELFDTGGENTAEASPTSSAFLILHVVTEYVTDSALQAVAEAFHRPRNKLKVIYGNGVEPTLDEYRWGGEPLFYHYVDFARNQLNRGLDAAGIKDQYFDFALKGGAYLGEFPSDEKSKQSRGKNEPARPTQENLAHHRRRQEAEREKGNLVKNCGADEVFIPKVKSYRLVVALPMLDNKGLPRDEVSSKGDGMRALLPYIYSAHQRSERRSDNWSDYETFWAWQLATGHDLYGMAVPSVTDLRGDTWTVRDYYNWETFVNHDGAAYVRRPLAAEGSDFEFFRLVPTRFVDVALLNLRAQRALEYMRNALGDASGLAANDEGDSPDFRAVREYEEKISQLKKIQVMLANFRKELWFETAVGHMEAADLLAVLQERTGARQAFDDFMSQLSIQEKIVETHHKQQSERQDRERSDQREFMSAGMAFIGVLLAVPALIELLDPMISESVKVFLIIIYFGISVVLIGYFVYQRRKRRNRRS